MTHRSSRIGLLLAVATAILCAAPTVHGQSDADLAKARNHYERGRQAFDAGQYQRAIREFATADRIAPSAILEYNIGLCHEQLGEKAEAIRRFRLYLDRMPNAKNRPEVESRIRQLEADIAAKGSAEPTPPQPTPPPLTDGPDVTEQPGEEPTELPDSSDSGAGQGGLDTGSSSAAGPAMAPTGDAELDRVAAIDPSAIREQRYGSSVPPQPGTGDAGGAAGPVEPRPADKPRASKPFYKQWWFWVVAGVGAIIVYDIATSDSDDDGGSRQLFPLDNSNAVPSSGAVLWRF